MAHDNVHAWELSDRSTPRPCDWCGCPVPPDDTYIHHRQPCQSCGRQCLKLEGLFYLQLAYDGDSEVAPPPGYQIVIPPRPAMS